MSGDLQLSVEVRSVTDIVARCAKAKPITQDAAYQNVIATLREIRDQLGLVQGNLKALSDSSDALISRVENLERRDGSKK